MIHRRITFVFIVTVALLTLFSLSVAQVTAAGVIYVDQDATSSSPDGSSWDTAYTSLQDALAVAAEGDEIWVAEGIYSPGSNAADTFQLARGIAIYGGFAGSETERTERDWEQYVTVLSGDIDGDDLTDENGVVETADNIVGVNNYHLLTAQSLTSSTIVDGFAITAGYASRGSGAGFTLNASSPTLANLIISGNKASGWGAGISNRSGSPSLTNVLIRGNQAGADGGGIFNVSGSCQPTLTNVTFENNSAGSAGGGIRSTLCSPILNQVAFNNNSARSGGGIYDNYNAATVLNDVSFSNNTANLGGGLFTNQATLTNVTFTGNHANSRGGGLFILDFVPNDPADHKNATLTNVIFDNNSAAEEGGGIYSYGDEEFEENVKNSPVMFNVVLNGNSARTGGGMTASFSTARMVNVTFSNNQGGALHNTVSSTSTIINGIFWNNSDGNGQGSASATILNDASSDAVISYSLIQSSGGSSGWNSAMGSDGGNNIDADPLFVSAVDLQLRSGSPAINVGDNLANATTNDVAGNERIQQNIIDMGAYESSHTLGDQGVIKATVWDDLDGDGVFDPDEPTVDGIWVSLLNTDGEVVERVRTADGTATFYVEPGRYRLHYLLPNNWFAFTLPHAGTDKAADSDASRNSGRTPIFTVDTDELVDDMNAGVWSPALIEAELWHDLNGNGVRDSDEPPASDVDVVVSLLNSKGETLDVLTTHMGMVVFYAPADQVVTLQFDLPAGYDLVKPNAGNDPTIDSDANPRTGKTPAIKIRRGGAYVTEWDAGVR